MAKFQAGADALNVLNQSDDGGNKTEFTSFKSGSKYYVKVLGTADLISFFSYGIFGKVNSFVAESPSKKSAKGFPVEDLTPWDKAFKFHRDQSEEFSDKQGVEASKYKAKQRFAMGFYDLDSGEPIIIDVSKNQAQAIHGAIQKYEKKLGKLAFELTKQGQSTSTTVSLTPVLDFEDDLTDKQQENFGKAPEEFDMSLFDGLLYEADETEQLKLLQQAGFDVTKIGFEVPSVDSDEATPVEDSGDSEEYPF